MPLNVQPLYLASLGLFAAVFFVCAYGWATLLRPKLSLLGGLPGGFIALLAANELLALPFMTLHLSFKLYYPLFLAMNLAVLGVGAAALFRARAKRPDIKKAVSLAGLLAFLAAGFLVLSTQFYAQYNADDAYYVSLTQQSLNSSRLYSVDAATGNPAIAPQPYYKFEGWELTKAGLAKSFGLNALEVSHGLVPILIVVMAFLAHRAVFRLFFKDRRKVNLATLFLAALLLFGGYSPYSQGVFLLTRSWQGKAALAAVIIPFLLFVLLKLEDARHAKRAHLTVGLVSLAALALNPSSIFIVASAIATWAVIVFAQGKKSLAVKLLVGTLPLVLAAAAIAAGGKQASVAPQGFYWSTAVDNLKAFTGPSWYFLMLILAVPALLFARNKEARESTKRLALFTVLLAVIALNPLLFGIFGHYLGTTYWRFYWLVPITLLLPAAAALVADGTWLKTIRKIAWAPLTAALLTIFMLAGTNILDPANGLAVRDSTRYKLPVPIVSVLTYMSAKGPANVVATEDISTYYHNLPTGQTLAISRPLYYPDYCAGGGEWCADQLKLFNYANGQPGDTAKISRLLRKYHVKYVITTSQDLGRVLVGGQAVIYRNDRYAVIRAT